jgi:hypothetical protein
MLIGFTLTNGAAPGGATWAENGGGAWCESSGAVISNCYFLHNAANQYGAGAFRGTLLDCLLINNSANHGGGACSNILVHCTLTKNFASYQNPDSGGGAIYSTLTNCLLVANSCFGGGGGAAYSVLASCVVSNNTGNSAGGGLCMSIATGCLISSNRTFNMGGGSYSNVLVNCILKNNVATGTGGGADNSVLINCTVVSNSAGGPGGGVYTGRVTNSIVYYNSSANGANYLDSAAGFLSYCCTTPMATNGLDNITNEPAFVDVANGDFHFQTNSPCINAGNNSCVTGSTDFDGSTRIVGGTVDIGAYEFQSPASLIAYAYLQQYGLPIDGSSDYLDSDGDGLNNWQEWRAGTSPVDASSVLQMTSAAPTDSSQATITWQSVAGVYYYIQSSPDLSQPFQTIATNIAGLAGVTSYTDVTVTNGASCFYRVGVQ